MQFKSYARLTASAALAAAALFARPAVAADAPAPQFQSGDRWSAVGDSITHGGWYHDFVYLYYVTRFPGKKFDMTNAGISGDTAVGTLRRYDWDVAAYKPTVATIMLGMNDVGTGLYGIPETDQILKDRKYNISRYAAAMRELATKLKASGVKVILITPSIFDQTVVFVPKTPDAVVSQPAPEGLKGGNDGLVDCAAEVRKIAKDLDLPVVDFNDPMVTINAVKQKTDPHYTLIGRDRVHPGETGHFVMAYELLKAQNAPQYVAQLSIDAKKGKVKRAEGCNITDLKGDRTGAIFTIVENALPYPMPEGAKPALELVPFAAELNREPMVVTGLKSGKYTLKIDGAAVGTWDADALAAGIDLASLTNSPEYQQAITVRDIDRKRALLLSEDLRTIAYIEYRYAKDGFTPGNSGDAALLQKAKAAAETEKSAYTKFLWKTYAADKPKEAELRANLAALVDAEWTAAQPKPHVFAIAPSVP